MTIYNQINKNSTTAIFKKKFIALTIVFCGFITQSLGMEETYLLWKGERNPDALQMNQVSPVSFGTVSDHWRVVQSSLRNKIFEIVEFPGKNRSDKSSRDYKAYRPDFPQDDKPIDTLIFTRSEKAGFLDNFWVPNGFSSHVLMGLNGDIFIHANILNDEKAQMAGVWNNRSFEIAFIDLGNQELSYIQQEALKNFLDIYKTPKLQLKFGGSIWDAKQVQGVSPEEFTSGKVNNISEILENLSLTPLNKYFETPNDISHKYTND